MAGIAKFNKKNLSTEWGIDTKEFDFYKPKDIELDKVHKLYGLFVTKGGKYGDNASAILEDKFVNISQSYLEEVKDILADEDAIQYIKDGHAGIIFSKFHSDKYDKDGYSVEFVDL